MRKERNARKEEVLSLDEAKVLLSQLGDMNLRQEDIHRATRISQSQISRLIAGDFKRVQGNALKLCKYAKEAQSLQQPPQASDIEREIIECALGLWDRTESSGFRVLTLLQALRALLAGR